MAQNEIGHARAIYQLLSEDADALAFDRSPDEYRCSRLVELRLVPDWARTIARHHLYESFDEARIVGLKESSDPAVAGLAAKIDRAEAEVEVVLDDSWSTDRITPEGRDKLREAGFAPPAPRTAGTPELVQLQHGPFRCPYCGSTDTALENIFGPTPCRSLRYCRSC